MNFPFYFFYDLFNHSALNERINKIYWSGQRVYYFSDGCAIQRNVAKKLHMRVDGHPEMVKKSPAFYGTWRFMTVPTRTPHWALSWVRLIQYPLHFFEIYLSIYHIYLGFPNCFFSWCFHSFPAHKTSIRVIKWRILGWVEHIAHMEKWEMGTKF